jgi:hypothetical protein
MIQKSTSNQKHSYQEHINLPTHRQDVLLALKEKFQ